ncbi:DNA ligase [Poseidonibacter lekithochrous]|uniref:DNA ligase n=1 Tax=Poseidonibacter TaxID=2321187 RepID=UPI001C07F492|nr:MULTISPECIES: DNA ligase [Poseidonibacter]MBU3014258.1 DNA ligase [Poseidonibacter lekithochrous]MDO6827555.1 DNA ligase [Poseidonibacter sp. 1_MG-2023]
MKSFFTLLLISILSHNLSAIELQKAKTYNKTHSIENWMMSEKLDGIRAYWDGKQLLSKNGNIINAPKWFVKDFPNFKLDGELWTKRNDFENIQSIVLDKTPSKHWKEITYNIFEVPYEKGDFIKRLKKIKEWQKVNKNKYIKIIEQIKCKDNKHLESYLEKLIKLKAEGIMIKNPSLEYFVGRSSNILKVKKFLDSEAEVIGINYNKDKQNKFKSLVLKLENNVVFNLGNGFTAEQRINHPKIGDIVTFKYYNLTRFGKPKFASFLRIRKKE